MDSSLDCLIVGGGAAGLSAALVLGRARRRVLLVDAGRQSNLPAHGIGGLLGHEQRPPQEFYARALEELATFASVTILSGEVSALSADEAPEAEPHFRATLATGTESATETVRTGRVLLAGGMNYHYPELDGVAERWGDGVFHCPFCHGWEMRGRALAVLGGGPIGTHQARLLTAWSDQVTLLPDGEALEPGQRDALAGSGVAIDERRVRGVRGPGTSVEAVIFRDGGELAVGGLQVRTSLHQRDQLAAGLGVELTPENPMSSEAIAVDHLSATSVPGVWAAGDLLGRPPSVASAVAQGHMAGAMIVAALTGVL